MHAASHFHPYLYGNQFAIRTDHASLQWLLNFKNPEGQMARWLQKLQQCNFTIHHRRGRLHGNADALSRRPCEETACKYCEKREVRDADVNVTNGTTIGHKQSTVLNVLCETITNQNEETRIIEAQNQDPEIRVILQLMQESTNKPPWQEVASYSVAVKTYWGQWQSLKVHDGKLYRYLDSETSEPGRWQLVVPQSLRREVFEQVHGSPTCGHFGVKKTLARIRERFFWPSCRQSVEPWCRNCEQCQVSKGPGKKHKGPMKQFNVGAPLERVALDILGPLPTSKRGNKYILIVGDYFTKWVEAYPLQDQRAETIAMVFVREFVSRFGVPLQLHSDQGRNFESVLFNDVCNLLGMDKTRTTALHPQSDGMVERFNRTLENQLAVFVKKHQQDWDDHVPLILLAYRSAVHESTGQTLSCLMFGREVNLPVDLLYGRPPDEHKFETVEDYVDQLRNRMKNVHEYARMRIRIASDRMKRRYDVGSTRETFKCGDAVWLYNPQRKKGLSPKLSNDWEGPYLVTKQINELLYRIKKSPRAKSRIVHRNRLWRYLSNRDV